MTKRKTDPAETPEGEALPVETPAPAARPRVTFEVRRGGSSVTEPRLNESTEESLDAGE